MRRFAKSKPQREPTIALINIVFLMLVFFMVAGTLAQPLDPDL
ncbi:MAG TPA: biopolymer transporter ExbD, partial [Sulfitobacter pontiacus]|nr:biopolymer transporter ExbD [Sulfitobacter pontiacus]